MSGSIWVMSCAISVGLGVIAGYLLGRRELKRYQMSEDRIDPQGAPHVRRATRVMSVIQKVVAGVVAVIAVVLVVQYSNASDRDRQQSEQAQALAEAQAVCNSQLYDAIDKRAAGNREDSELQQADNAALLELVTGLLSLPPGAQNQADSVQEQLGLYKDKIEKSDERRKEIAQQRAENPYPVPSCGMESNE